MKYKKIIFAILFLFGVFAISYFYGIKVSKAEMETQGNFLKERIETYHNLFNKYPNNFDELNLNQPEDRGPFFYSKEDVFIIYYDLGKNNYYIYSSLTKEWNDAKLLPVLE
ncbi:MAG: hypothetical protein MJ211_15125 [Bacteroidales bacterium]|nr:hypothetical protein [Bacteroidales bacterium]